MPWNMNLRNHDANYVMQWLASPHAGPPPELAGVLLPANVLVEAAVKALDVLVLEVVGVAAEALSQRLGGADARDAALGRIVIPDGVALDHGRPELREAPAVGHVVCDRHRLIRGKLVSLCHPRTAGDVSSA